MSFIVFSQPYKGHKAMVVTAEKAKKIQETLDNPPDEITEDQAEFLMCIKHIYHGKRTENRDVDTSHLTHEGIEQGVMQGLPVNDR